MAVMSHDQIDDRPSVRGGSGSFFTVIEGPVLYYEERRGQVKFYPYQKKGVGGGGLALLF